MERRAPSVGVAALAVLVVAVQLLTAALGKPFYLTQLSMAAYYAIVVMGLCLVMGYAGQISLGHGAFFAIGGYTSAFLTTRNLGAALPAGLRDALLQLGLLTPRQDLYGAQTMALSPWLACLAALYFAGEAKDAKVKLAGTEAELAQVKAGVTTQRDARQDEVARLKAEIQVYLDKIAALEEVAASSDSKKARVDRLKSLAEPKKDVPT